jgi:hypothetical protein
MDGDSYCGGRPLGRGEADKISAGKMRQSENRRVREEGEKVERQRLAKLALRRSQMWVDGKPTEMAYLIAQAIANIAAYFHPDPNNPSTVRGVVAEIETTDEVPVRARARKFADIQKTYLKIIEAGQAGGELRRVLIGTSVGTLCRPHPEVHGQVGRPSANGDVEGRA